MGVFDTSRMLPSWRISACNLFVVGCLFLFAGFKGAAQRPADAAMEVNLEQELLPLDTVIALAQEHSPVLEHYQALIDKSGHEIDLARRMWQNNIYGFANYSTGDQRIVTGGTAIPGDVETSSLATGYRAGLQINIPLFEFTGRRSRIKLHEAEQRAMVSRRDEMRMDLHRLVTDEYFMVLGAFESLKTRSEGKEALRTYYLVAEQEFEDGVISIGELSQVKNSLSTAEFYYQNAKYDFYRLFSAFSVLVGVSPSDLTISYQYEPEPDSDH